MVSFVSSQGLAQAPTDFAPDGEEWNGLGDFIALGQGRGIDLTYETGLDLDDLPPADAVWIVHPTEELPGASLTAFLKGGGRLVI
ncbi:MAG: hypothetical protein KC416_13310, partial [Myxococcales bacterium]|nr:hypothetical protein [Myxococcales bacterium]